MVFRIWQNTSTKSPLPRLGTISGSTYESNWAENIPPDPDVVSGINALLSDSFQGLAPALGTQIDASPLGAVQTVPRLVVRSYEVEAQELNAA